MTYKIHIIRLTSGVILNTCTQIGDKFFYKIKGGVRIVHPDGQETRVYNGWYPDKEVAFL